MPRRSRIESSPLGFAGFNLFAYTGAFTVYALVYLGLAIVASIPFGLGWLVLGPMVVGSCYAGWRTIFGRG